MRLRAVKRHIGILLELGKVRIALVATLSTAAGYVLADGAVTSTLLWVTVGVFLLASGSSGLNHVQDRDIDAAMVRTRARPLPSRRVNLTYAVGVSTLWIASGAVVVLAGSNAMTAALGLAAVGWYNGVYTPLKRVSAFAAVPGGLVGAIPPVIGWVAGGGHPLDPKIMAVSFFFFMWQVPHFWLLLLFSCGKDYEKAALPSMTRTFSRGQISRVTFTWIVATVTACILIPLFGDREEPWVIAGFFCAGGWVVFRTARVLWSADSAVAYGRAFRHINVYAVWVISLLSAAGLLR